MNLLNENNFEKEYEKIIVPFCNEKEKSSEVKTFDGKTLHYLSYINEKPQANILILHGFTECAKKFDEMAYYFYNEGYNVYSLDLRGHGLSYKDKAPKYGVSIKDFSVYAKDVSAFVNDVIGDELPLYVYTHSLGGNVALLSMIECNLNVDKLVLSSPMICGNMGMPVAVAKKVAKMMTKVGKGNAPAPGKCEFHPEKLNTDATSEARAIHSMKLKEENSEYQTCGPDFNWVYASVLAMEKLTDSSNIAKLKGKILVIKPEEDAQLLESYQDKFIALCKEKGKDVSLICTKGTHHEIFQSSNEALEKYLEAIFNFYK